MLTHRGHQYALSAPAMSCRASTSTCPRAASAPCSAQRRRQDDDGEDHHGAGAAERRARCMSTSTDITGWPPHRVAREGVAYVPEGRLIFPDLTVIENIKVAERNPARAWPLARLLELFPSLRSAPRNQRLAALGRRTADAGDRPGACQRSQGAAARRAEPGTGAVGRARACPHHPPPARRRRHASCWSSRT